MWACAALWRLCEHPPNAVACCAACAATLLGLLLLPDLPPLRVAALGCVCKMLLQPCLRAPLYDLMAPARLAELIADSARPDADRLCAARVLFRCHAALQAENPAAALEALPDARIEQLCIGLLAGASLPLRALACRCFARGALAGRSRVIIEAGGCKAVLAQLRAHAAAATPEAAEVREAVGGGG